MAESQQGVKEAADPNAEQPTTAWRRGYQLDSDAAKFTVAMAALEQRIKLRQFCIEQAVKAGEAGGTRATMDNGAIVTQSVADLAKEFFDFCCDDITTILAGLAQDKGHVAG